MKHNYFSRQILLLIHQLSVIAYLFALHFCKTIILPEHYAHLIIVSLFFTDAAYISYKNIQNNQTLNHFTFLLLLSGWQFLLSAFHPFPAADALSVLLLPVCLCQTVYFVQMFLFQASAYRYRSALLYLTRLFGIGALICYFISPRAFAFAYLGQALISLVLVLLVGLVHRRRIWFVLKNHRSELLLSLIFVALPFACYTAAFFKYPGYMENMGSCLLFLPAFFSIHVIVCKSRPKQASSLGLTGTNAIFLASVGLLLAVPVIFVFRIPFAGILLLYQCAILLAMLSNLLLYRQVCRQTENPCGPIDRQHFYEYSLQQIKREENLRKDFSNYLHDDVLQDLLSVKNLLKKADQPQVQQLLQETLSKRCDSIRQEMQSCHPTLPQSLTLKENLRNLLDTLSEHSSTSISLDCDDSLFLVEPYTMLLYRMIKELVTNAGKHSCADNIQVTLLQKNGQIFLEVSDNGHGFEAYSCNHSGHRGLNSIQEQVRLLGGRFTICSTPETGTRITVSMPMKGENSYENFIAR